MIQIEITQGTNLDYDGNMETVKEIDIHINGKKIDRYYSYPVSTSDETIETEVQADLISKGYTW